jgi:hypothetical protein
MLIYHLGDKQQVRWWPQFRDVFPPYRQITIVLNHSYVTYLLMTLFTERANSLALYFGDSGLKSLAEDLLS